MKKSKLAAVLFTAIATTVWVSPAIAGPDDPKTEQSQAKDQAFSGKVESVDKTGKTLTVDGKAYSVSDTSRITKEGKTVTLSDLSVGDQVLGKTREVDGKFEIVSLTITAKKTKDS